MIKRSFTLIRKIRMDEIGCCELCGRKFGLELHHIIPKSLGGDDTEENLILVCRMCHTRLTPKTTLVKQGFTKKAITEYLSSYLPKKYYLLSKEMFREDGYMAYTEFFADVFDRLIAEECSRFQKTGNLLLTWRELNSFEKDIEKANEELDNDYEKAFGKEN